MSSSLWRSEVYSLLIVILAESILIVPYFLGQRHHQRATGSLFQSGIVSEG
jgi:NADH-quinone oxidoreductase subunit A